MDFIEVIRSFANNDSYNTRNPVNCYGTGKRIRRVVTSFVVFMTVYVDSTFENSMDRLKSSKLSVCVHILHSLVNSLFINIDCSETFSIYTESFFLN